MNIVTRLFPSFHPRQVMFRAVLFMRILNSITFGGDGVASEKNKKHSVKKLIPLFTSVVKLLSHLMKALKIILKKETDG